MSALSALSLPLGFLKAVMMTTGMPRDRLMQMTLSESRRRSQISCSVIKPPISTPQWLYAYPDPRGEPNALWLHYDNRYELIHVVEPQFQRLVPR